MTKARNNFWPTAARVRRARGFTLIELMMTLTVAAIMMAIAIPSMRTFLQNQRIASTASTLMYALSYARSEAVKENNPTTLGVGGIEVCPSLNGATCDNAGNWSDGWVVLSPNPNIVGPLQVLGSLPPGVTVTQNAALPAVIFQGTGMLPPGQVAAFGVPMCNSRSAIRASARTRATSSSMPPVMSRPRHKSVRTSPAMR